MSVPHHTRRGFTLVEILIVVVILGILASIVVPQFTNASESAKGSSVAAQLRTIRNQLELYKIQHNGSYPTLAQLQASWGVMISKTDPDGTLNAAGACGPYMQHAPRNPIESSSTVAAAAAGVGWVYDASTGNVKACMSSARATAMGISASDAATY